MKRIAIFFLLIFQCYIKLCSQTSINESVVDLKTFGIGIGLFTPIISPYYEPFGNIILTININQKFRIEPEFGFSIENYEEEGASGYSTSTKVYLFIINGLAIIKRDRAGLLLGPKLGYISSSEQFHQNNTDASTSNRKSIFIGPVIGMEYYMSKHLSMSGEFDVIYLKAFGNSFDQDKFTGNTFKPEVSLKLHFYL
jgi:hypothetical protein